MEQKINLDRLGQAEALFGSFDENVRLIEKEFGVALVVRDSELKVTGDDPEAVDKASRTVKSLLTLIGSGETLTEQNVRYCIRMVGEDSEDKVASLAGDVVCITSKGKPIKPKTVGQRTYCQNIKENTITIGVGPAGTGKTYLAVAMAVNAFRAQQVNRIILTRPAVEAGEKLGFLPGTCSRRWTPICAPCTMPCLICWGPKPTSAMWSGAISRWRPWPICGAALWTTASSSWTRPRTPPGSR